MFVDKKEVFVFWQNGAQQNEKTIKNHILCMRLYQLQSDIDSRYYYWYWNMKFVLCYLNNKLDKKYLSSLFSTLAYLKIITLLNCLIVCQLYW